MAKLVLLMLALACSVPASGQDRRCLVEKPGRWMYDTNLPAGPVRLRNTTVSQADSLAFKDRMAQMATWFRQRYPMLGQPKGYDLLATTRYVWDDSTAKSDAEYGIPAAIDFTFLVFFADGTQWTVEPPQFEVGVNGIAGGHEGWYFAPESVVNDGSRYDRTQSAAVDTALARLRGYFAAFPLKQQPLPGVHVYETSDGGYWHVVIFNPDRPPFWIPVTVRDVADASVAYYALFLKTELDRLLLQELKKEIASLSPQELAAPAHMGHDSHFVLKVNGQGQGLPLMRFNPAYWDTTLPTTAVQFITYGRAGAPEAASQSGCPDYPAEFGRILTWKDAATLIQRR